MQHVNAAQLNAKRASTRLLLPPAAIYLSTLPATTITTRHTKMAAPRGIERLLVEPNIRNKLYHHILQDITEVDNAAYKPLGEIKPYLAVTQVCRLMRIQAYPMLFEQYVPRVAWLIKGKDEAPSRLAGFLECLNDHVADQMQMSLMVTGSDHEAADIHRNNAFAANMLSTIREIAGHANSQRDMQKDLFFDWINLRRFRELPLAAFGDNSISFENPGFEFELRVAQGSEHHLFVTGRLSELTKRWGAYFKYFEEDRRNKNRLSLLPPAELEGRYRVQCGAPKRGANGGQRNASARGRSSNAIKKYRRGGFGRGSGHRGKRGRRS